MIERFPEPLQPLARHIREGVYALYLRKLESERRSWTIPEHVGIIMDGNRRHARESSTAVR